MTDDAQSETHIPVYTADNFRDAVKEFITIEDRLSEIRKDTSMLNKRKKKLSELIINFMTSNNKEFCNLGEKGTLAVKTSKTTLALKKDQVAQLLQQLGNDETKSAEISDFLFSNKIVKERSVLKRSTRVLD